MKICRLCKHPNPDDNNYCDKCKLSFENIAVKKRYYNEKEDPLTKVKKDELHRHKKTTNGSKILSFFGGVLVILITFGIPIGGYIYLNQDVNTYNKAIELWNEGEIKDAFEVAKKIPEDSRQYKKAQKLIKNAEDHLLYSEAVELWNEGEIKDAFEVAKKIPKDSRQYKKAQKLIKNAEDHLLYSKAVELWNEGEIKDAFEVAKKIPKDSIQYKKAQKLIKDGNEYLLYNKGAALWNDGNYEEAVKIFESFTEESEYYKQAQSVLKDM